MATLTDLTYTDNMAANKKPLLTDLRETLDSFETYINSSLVDAILDIVADAWPSGYAFTDNGPVLGVARFTASNLYNKLTAKDTYTGGNIAISSTGAWTDVDTSNAAIAITPDYLAGDFKATFQFNVSIVTTNATNEADIRFRLSDGSTTSDAIAKVRAVTGVTATTSETPVSISHEFEDWAASAQSVKLQYFIVTSTATTINVLANSNSPIAMQVEKI